MKEDARVDHRADLNLLVRVYIITNNHLDGSRDVIDEHIAIQVKGKRGLNVRRLKHALEAITVPPVDSQNLVRIPIANKV